MNNFQTDRVQILQNINTKSTLTGHFYVAQGTIAIQRMLKNDLYPVPFIPGTWNNNLKIFK